MRFLISLVLAGAALAANPQLEQVKTVYLLPMGGSLDQYLANWLTQTGVFQVVTDPKIADAIFTDKIGEGFQQKMDELYPPPEPPKPKDEEVDKDKDKDKEKDKDPYGGKPVQRVGSFSRGRGTVFLVDRRTHNVVWSIYSPVRSTRPDDVDRRADQIVKQLQKAQKSK